MSNTFEEKLFKQAAYWVSELSVDSLIPNVTMQLIANPHTNDIECDVIFPGVNNVTINFHGGDDDVKPQYLCTLLGIDIAEMNGVTKYTITTDTTEVIFTSSLEPEIKWANPDKKYQKWDREIIKMGK